MEDNEINSNKLKNCFLRYGFQMDLLISALHGGNIQMALPLYEYGHNEGEENINNITTWTRVNVGDHDFIMKTDQENIYIKDFITTPPSI